jgi:anti-sigma regulatory factor (Ser/Thr protein kinase)
MNGSPGEYALPAPVAMARVAGGGTGTVAGRSCLLSEAPVSVLPSHTQGTPIAEKWPRRSYLAFGALTSAAPCARLHARHVLSEWGLRAVRESVELVVSELVTNAIKASQAMEWPFPVRLWLLSANTRVLVLVWDGNPQPPMRLDAIDEAESGRGLVLVEALSQKWGWYAHAELGGKVTWALIAPEVPGQQTHDSEPRP